MIGESAGSPIDFERYAEVSAYQRHFSPEERAEVLARMGLDPRAFQIVSARIASVFDAEIAAGRVELLQQFAATFLQTFRRLQKENPPLSSIGPLSGPPPPLRGEAATHNPAAYLPGGVGPAAPAVTVLQARGACAFEAPSIGSPSGMKREHPTAELSMTAPAPTDAAPKYLPFRVDPTSGRPSSGTHGGVPSPPPGTQELTLEQYTALRVELQVYPEHMDAILSRYRLSRDGLDATLAHWRQRFEVEPHLQMSYMRGYAEYVSSLRANSRNTPFG